VSDTIPTTLTGASWTCAVTTAGTTLANAGAYPTACSVASGTGNVSLTVTLQPGGVITITVTATSSVYGNLTNTASIDDSGKMAIMTQTGTQTVCNGPGYCNGACNSQGCCNSPCYESQNPIYAISMTGTADPNISNNTSSIQVLISCASDANCPSGQLCNTSTGLCVACLTNANCSGSTPICNLTTHVCEACPSGQVFVSGSCVTGTCGNGGVVCSGATPYCNSTNSTCVACITNSNCTDTSKAICKNNSCVGCSADSDCTSPAKCDLVSGVCKTVTVLPKTSAESDFLNLVLGASLSLVGVVMIYLNKRFNYSMLISSIVSRLGY
jgi:hypothetical protein